GGGEHRARRRRTERDLALEEMVAHQRQRARIALPEAVAGTAQLAGVVLEILRGHVVEREEHAVARPVVPPEGGSALRERHDRLTSEGRVAVVEAQPEPPTLAPDHRVL